MPCWASAVSQSRRKSKERLSWTCKVQFTSNLSWKGWGEKKRSRQHDHLYTNAAPLLPRDWPSECSYTVLRLVINSCSHKNPYWRNVCECALIANRSLEGGTCTEKKREAETSNAQRVASVARRVKPVTIFTRQLASCLYRATFPCTNSLTL